MMLQQQVPSPSIPRFNPHGYQPPPVEKKKEETFYSSKAFSSSSKKRLEVQEVVDFKQFNIEDLLGDYVSTHAHFKSPSLCTIAYFIKNLEINNESMF